MSDGKLPTARVIRGGASAGEIDDDKMWTPVTPADVTDEKLVAGQLRALQREVRSGFELITQKVLGQLDRLHERLDVALDRVSELEARQSRTEDRLAALERGNRTARRK